MIVVSRDYEGLRIAAMELLEEQRTSRDQELRFRNLDLANTANADAVLEQMAHKRTVSDGYYMRVRYLFWLEGMLKLNAVIPELQVNEAEGLEAVSAARNEFRSKYPPCGRCGFPNHKFIPRCAECGAELAPKGRT